MKTIVGLFWAVIGGLFLACGVIVFTQLIGAGADLLGFTKWTFRYYVLCLGVCTAMLIMSKPARKHWHLMGGFFVSAVMVIGIGFHAFAGDGSGQGPAAQMQANLLSIALLAAKAVMYAAPGGLTAFYAFVAYSSVSKVPLKPPY